MFRRNGEMPEEIVTTGETPTPTTETVETFDKDRAMALIAKLRGEVKDLTPKARKADELEQAEAKRKEADMTELQKLQAKLTEAESRLKLEGKARLQREAAEKVGIPASFAKRLTGETPDELEADAKEILDTLPKSDKKAPHLSATNPGGATTGETLEQRLARIHGADKDYFSPELARQMGGGVSFTTKTE
jgi:chromosome segregation ATPase